MSLERSESYEFSDFHLNVPERLVTKNGKAVPMSEKVFETLCTLVRRSGSLVTKDELLSEVWPNTVVEENNLDKSISRLRQILGEKKGENIFIETVRGHGYRFVAPVKIIDNTGAASIRVSPERKSQNKGLTSEVEIKNSIAVLPFKNLSNDPENDYFGDGLAEDLLNALSKIRTLKVAARTSAFSFKNRNVDVGEIGRTLKVNTILDGSLRKSGDTLRVVVHLINASDGYQIWSDRYDSEIKDVFALQDQITLSVIDGLKVKFGTDELSSVRSRYGENVHAYQLYLKGRYHSLKLTPPETWKGISYFEQAIAIDPEYSLAYSGLAAAYVTLPLASDGRPIEFFPKASDAAKKAIELDDGLSENYSALFWATFWFDWDWPRAKRESLKAIELNPKSPDGYEAYAHVLSNVGQHDEAIDAIERARALDPLHLRINALEGQFLLHAGEVDAAIERLRKTLELEPRFWLAHLFLSSAYSSKEMYAEAIDSAQRARELSGSTHPIAFMGYALAKAGRVAEAQAMQNELLKMSSERYIPPPHIAMIYNGLGQNEVAFEWLERGYASRDSRMAFIKVEPKWNNLRSDPRFIDLMTRMNFDQG